MRDPHLNGAEDVGVASWIPCVFACLPFPFVSEQTFYATAPLEKGACFRPLECQIHPAVGMGGGCGFEGVLGHPEDTDLGSPRVESGRHAQQLFPMM